tara:strand:+ start:410 stop:790 length:381 start_codon:yes stop_codon:yes gene_type:complete
MKRSRSSSKNLNVETDKKLKIEFASEVITEVVNELNEIKMSKTIENLNLINHIQNTLKNLDVIKKQVIKKSVSNESIEYLKELEEDFLHEIYNDVDSTYDSQCYFGIQNNIAYISDDELENHPITF